MKNKLVLFKGHVGKKLAVLGALTYCGMANAAGKFAATDSITPQLGNLKDDVSGEITPVAIGVVVAIAMLVAGRGLIKKFFKI